jgi:hypothetical protein
MTHLTSPRHSYTDSSHQDSLSQPSQQPPMVHLRRALNLYLLSLHYHKLHQVNTDFGFASHMPPTDCISRLPQNLLECPTLGYLSSILAVLPQFFLALEPFLNLFSPNILPKYAFLGCAPLCSYRDSKGHQCETSRPLGVSFPSRTHTQTTHRTPSWTWCTQTSPHAHQPSCLLINTPHPWVCTPFLVLFSCVHRHDSSWVCPWGCPTSLVCPCCRGQMGPLLGNSPKFPHPFPNTTQVSINHSKASEVCAPLVPHMSPSCAQDAPAHTHMSSFSPIDHMPLGVLLLDSSPSLPKECMHSLGVMGDLTSSPTPSCFRPQQHLSISMEYLPHLWISSPLNDCCLLNCCHQGKLPLGSYMSL